MAEVNTGGGGEAKKGKPKKMHLRVDFTPMVDMNMLLITFFMFCTTLSKPQIMNLVVPTKDKKEIDNSKKNQVDDLKTITVLLGSNDEVYYYEGQPKYEDYTSLIKTNYSPTGFRAYLVKRNGAVIDKMRDLRAQKQQKKITEEEFTKQSDELLSDKKGLVVIIKPTDGATYKNLVDVLDEIQICSIGIYAIVDVTDGDKFMIQNYLEKGALSAQAGKFKNK